MVDKRVFTEMVAQLVVNCTDMLGGWLCQGRAFAADISQCEGNSDRPFAVNTSSMFCGISPQPAASP